MYIDEIHIGLIVRFLKKEITEEEKTELFKWVYSNSSNEKHFYNLKDIWETAKYEQIIESAQTDTEWEKLALSALKKESENRARKKNVRTIFFQALKVAALVVIAFGIGFWVQHYFPEEVVYSSVNVPFGAKSQIELPDGSKVWVNAGSTLKYPGKMEGKEVNLFLEGEAFFDIVKNSDRKLNVRTSTLNIQVLGTQFNVKSYNDENVVETTLVNGSISITGRLGERVIEKPILLKPREQATLFKGDGSVQLGNLQEAEELTEKEGTKDETQITGSKSAVQPQLNIAESIDVEKFVSWKDDRLVFRNEPLESLAKRLERWYNVEIRIEDENLKRSRYTGTFENETIEQAIQALSISLPFEYKIDRNQIEIIRKRS